MITAVLLSLMAGQWAERRELRQQGAALHQTAQLYAQAAKGLIENRDHLPYVIARHPDVLALLDNPADQVLVNRVNRYFSDLQARTGPTALYVISKTGMVLAASNWNTDRSFVGQSYSQRPYVREALQGQRTSVYGFGLISGIHGLVTIEPVRHGKQVIGAVALKVIPSALENAWVHSTTPVILRDDRGIIFLSSVPDWLFQGSRPLAAGELAELIRTSQYGKRSSFDILPWHIEHTGQTSEYLLHTTLGGRPVSFLALDTSVPELGWTLTVTGDLAEVQHARREAIALAALIAAVLLLGGLYLQLRNRRFAELRLARLELELRVQQRTQAIYELNAFRKAMEDSLPVGIGACDPAWRIIYVNPAFCEMVGYSAEEMLGCKPPYPFWYMDKDNIKEYYHDNSAALRGKAEADGYESRYLHRNGHEVICMIYTAPLIDDEGWHRGWMSSAVDITERKRMEHALIKSEQELRSLSENLPDNIARYNQDARTIYVNPALEKTLGETAEKMLGKTLREGHNNDVLFEEYVRGVDSVLADGRDIEFELVFAKNGKPDAVHQIRMIPERDAHGKVSGVLAIGRVITARKHAERDLELLNAAVNASSEALFLMNEAGRFVHVNDAACKSLGYSRDELLKMTPLDIDPDITPESFTNLLQGVFAIGPSGEVLQSRHCSHDGRIFPVEISASLARYDGARFCLTLVRDISERKFTEEQIRRLSQAVEQSPSSIVITDLEANIVYVNRTFTDNTGYTQDEVIGKNSRILQSGKTPRQAYSDLWMHLKMGETWRGEFINRRKDGSEHIESAMISPVRDINGKIMNYLSIKEDITAQKQAAIRQQEQEQQLERSARLASLGEIASTVAHELNQPLMALSNFALAARTISSREQPLLTSALDDIVAQAQRASDIVKRIRSIIRPHRGNYEVCDIHTVLDDALNLLHPELKRRQTVVHTELAKRMPQMRGDPILLQQVLINLLQNAMQAMQDIPPSQRVIDIRTFRVEGAIQVQISDQGPGLPDALQARIFEPFFSTKANGLGLGLNICRTIVEAHGGSLQAANRTGGGAIFSISLPLSQ